MNTHSVRHTSTQTPSCVQLEQLGNAIIRLAVEYGVNVINRILKALKANVIDRRPRRGRRKKKTLCRLYSYIE